MTDEPTHDEANNQFYIPFSDGHRGVLDYRSLGTGWYDFYHTEVPEDHQGQGHASRLVKAGLAWIAKNDYRVRPTCWYVAQWLERHPDMLKYVRR